MLSQILKGRGCLQPKGCTKTLDAKGAKQNMKKTSPTEVMMHPLWAGPVIILGMMFVIQTLHTVTHWHMEIDADAYCKNNAEWVESQTSDDDY